MTKLKLTDKQSLFCREYLLDLNATQAAIRAKYSEKTAGAIGNENLQKPEIQAEIIRLNKNREKKTGITPERVIEEFGKIAFGTVDKSPFSPLKYADKNRALDSLAKHHNLYKDNNEALSTKPDFDLSKLSDAELKALQVLQEKMR